jgi:ribonuclease 6/7/8
MVAKLLHSRLCLLLLLGLLGIVPSLQAPPDNLTAAQWFEIQHIIMAHPQCNDAMWVVNSYRRFCKNKNTFLNTTCADAATVCGTQNITCHNPMQNLGPVEAGF